MSTHPYDDILKRAKDQLTADEQRRLVDELSRHTTKSNNGTAGRTLFDAFNDHGMIGSITDAPEDWSTNPKYMEGFGKDAE